MVFYVLRKQQTTETKLLSSGLATIQYQQE